MHRSGDGIPAKAIVVLWGLAVLAAVPIAAVGAETVELRYLQHSGWVLNTRSHVLVFDYIEELPTGARLPRDLRLTPESFDDRHVIVFVSHGHADHFFPGLADWTSRRRDLQLIVGWPESGLAGATVLGPRETLSLDGLEVLAINSTDQGVGFLAVLDDITIFHAGDHAKWSADDREAFLDEVLWLRDQRRPIDVALFPIATGATCSPRPSIWRGIRMAARELGPRVLLPMHVGCSDRLGLYEKFSAEVSDELRGTQVVAPTRIGALYRYENGRLTLQ